MSKREKGIQGIYLIRSGRWLRLYFLLCRNNIITTVHLSGRSALPPRTAILTHPKTENCKTHRRARIHTAYTTALAETQEVLEKERRRQMERQRKVQHRFRELVKRKGASEGEIERIFEVVGGCL